MLSFVAIIERSKNESCRNPEISTEMKVSEARCACVFELKYILV